MQTAPKGPFPFKGKGANIDWRASSLRERSELLERKIGSIIEEMRSLISEYDQSFEGKLPVYLVFHRTANGNYVRWRRSGVKQRYFAIANDEVGESFLFTQSSPVQEALLDFEKKRLRLNLLHGLYFYERKSLVRMIENVRRINKLQRIEKQNC